MTKSQKPELETVEPFDVSFVEIPPDDKCEETIQKVANGLGLGFGTSFFYLPGQFQSELARLQRTNVKLDNGLGTGIGIVLKHLPAQVQAISIKAPVDNAFATGN
jgi:hypothetical protein